MPIFYLIRHGQSEGNVNDKAYEDKDDFEIELTETGVGQAISVAKKVRVMLSGQNYQMYNSPYLRAVHTANIIAAVKPPIMRRESDLLIERRWTLDFRDEVKETKGNRIGRHFSFAYRPKGMESFEDTYYRADKFLQSITPSLQHVVIVGHGEMLRMLHMRLTDGLFEESPTIPNCKIYAAEYDYYKEQAQRQDYSQ